MKQRMMGWQWQQPDHIQSISLLQTDNHASTSSLQAGCPAITHHYQSTEGTHVENGCLRSGFSTANLMPD